MSFLIGLLTVILVLNCLLLILLVLIQLPKKEAGAGLAFGGAATDALFGAGSGNVLTKVTKYAAGVFFVLALSLSLLQGYLHTNPTREFERQTEAASSQLPGAPVVPDAAPAPTSAATNTSSPGLLTPTNLPAASNPLTPGSITPTNLPAPPP
jgi:preprotein translocase subunit SecG